MKLEYVIDSTLEEFAKMKLKLIKYHLSFSEELGFEDEIARDYSYKDAIKHFKQENYSQFLIKDEQNRTVGFVEIHQTNSNICLNEKCISIDNLYLKKEYRNKGYLKSLITVLRKHNKNLELECYYNLPAHVVYQNLGFKRFKTHYFL